MADFGQIGEAFVDIRANFGTFQSDLAGAQRKLGRNLQQIGQGFTQAGRALTIGLTLPILAAATATVKFGADFEREMTKINTLVGISQKRVGEMGKEVLALAKTTAVGPQELAKALFVVTSAGQRGAEAMKILEQAAKASAIGLGDTAEIARAVTSAVNAYGIETLNAERATEILVATVREGNLEASELAGSLGRVIGIASNVGVTFEQVGAFIATFTRVGVSAEEAVTSLRGALNILVKVPTKQTVEALDAVGSSVEQLRQDVVEKGIAQAFGDLVGSLEKVGIEVGQVFPNIRALSGILATVGSQGEEFIKITDNIANSQGILREGFDETRKTAAFLFRQVLTELQSITAELGLKLLPLVKNTLLPSLRSIVGVVGDLANAFGDLSPTMQTIIVGGLAFAAALGPILVIIGPLISGVGSLVIAFAAMGGAAAVAGTGMLTFGGILGSLLPIIATLTLALSTLFIAGFAIFELNELRKAANEFTKIGGQIIRDAQDVQTNVLGSFNALRQAAKKDIFPQAFGKELDELFAKFQRDEDIESFRQGLQSIGLRMKEVSGEAKKLQDVLDQEALAAEKAAEAAEKLKQAQDAKAAKELVEATKELVKQQKAAAEETGKALQPFSALIEKWNLAKEAGTTAAQFTAAFRDQIEQAGVTAEGSARLFDALGIEINQLPPALQEAVAALRAAQVQIDNTNISILALEAGIPRLGEGAARAAGTLALLGDGSRDLELNVQRVNDVIDDLEQESRDTAAEIRLLERDINDYRKANASAEQIQEKFGDRIEETKKKAKLFGIELGKSTKLIELDLEAKKENAEFAKKFSKEWSTAIGNMFGDFLTSLTNMEFSFSQFGRNIVNTLKSLGKTLLGTFASAFFSPILKAGQRFAENLADTIFSAFTGGQGPAGGLLGGVFGGGGGLDFGKAFGGFGTKIAGAFKSAIPFLTNPITLAIGALSVAAFGLVKAFTNTPLEAGVKEVTRDFGVKVSEDTLKGFTEGLGLTDKQFEPIRKSILTSPEAFKNLLLPAAEATGSVDELVASFGKLEAFGQVFDLSAEAAKAAGGDFADFNARFLEIFGGSEALVRQFGADLGGLLVEIPGMEREAGEEGEPIVRTGELLGDVFVDRLDALIETFGSGFEVLAEKLTEIVDSLTALISPDREFAAIGGADLGGSNFQISIQAIDSESFRTFMAGDGGDAFIEELLLRRSEQIADIVKSAEKGVEE